MESLLDKGPGPNIANKEFLQPGWKTYIKLIIFTSLRTESPEVARIAGIVPLLAYIGDLRTHAWSEIVENLAVGVLLRVQLIDQGICRVFPTKQKVVT